MNKNVMEIVIWKSKPEFSETEIVKRSKNLNEFVNNQVGFVSRDFAKNDEGQWIDFLYWDSLENAKAAAKKIETSPLCGEFFETIDMNSMQMFHFSSLYKHLAA